jgi:hypothetical protein
MGKQSFSRHAEYEGLKAFANGAEVGHVPAFYALTEDGKDFLRRGGEVVRLIHIDLAPDDPDDGNEKFLIAGKDDPPTITEGRLVELEPEQVKGKTGVGA